MLYFIQKIDLASVNPSVASTLTVGTPVRFIADNWVPRHFQTITVLTLDGAEIGKVRTDRTPENVGKIRDNSDLMLLYWLDAHTLGEVSSISGGLGGGYKVSIEYFRDTAYWLQGTPKEEPLDEVQTLQCGTRSERGRAYRVLVNRTHKTRDRCVKAMRKNGLCSPKKYVKPMRTTQKAEDLKDGRAGSFNKKRAELWWAFLSASENRYPSIEEMFRKEVQKA